jgi:hypothetical protein
VKRKLLEVAQSGAPSGGGTRPFGFEPDKRTIRESEAELIREVADRILAGDSLGAVCADWAQRGIATVTGREWLPNVLRGILMAPRVAGLRQHQGVVVGEAAWPPILDRPTWERLRAMFLAPQRRRQGAGRQLLTGLLVCGRCGARLMSGQNNGVRAYVCRRGPGKDGCAGLAMVAEPLEEVVVEAVLKLTDGPEIGRALRAKDRKTTDADAGAEVARLEAKLHELAEAWAADEIDRASWITARSAVEDRLQSARTRLARQSREDVLDPLVSGSGVLRQAWPTLNTDRRRAVLATLIDRVTIAAARRGYNKFDGSRISIDWRF